MPYSLGPIVIDLAGCELTAEENEILQHPLVGGVILFSRNYASPNQISDLTKTIRLSRKKPILIMTDHEGGRVQRFREGFTALPSMGEIGKTYAEDAYKALKKAEACGWTMASELRSVGIHLSLAPVLDLDKKQNTIIGDRAFSADPHQVSHLAKALIQGMKKAGMAATGKHFPGHGSVAGDTHTDVVEDHRSLEDIKQSDLIPFMHLIQEGIESMMPCHVRFPKIDTLPVGYSNHWLQFILRDQCHFRGVIISDDLSMKSASLVENYTQRAEKALRAGCNLLLMCNNRPGVIDVLDHLEQRSYLLSDDMARVLLGSFPMDTDYKTLRNLRVWKEAIKTIQAI